MMSPSEVDSLESEVSLYNAYMQDVGIFSAVSFGVKIFGDGYEVYIDLWDKGATYYFNSFDEALQYCKKEYPEADWSVLG